MARGCGMVCWQLTASAGAREGGGHLTGAPLPPGPANSQPPALPVLLGPEGKERRLCLPVTALTFSHCYGSPAPPPPVSANPSLGDSGTTMAMPGGCSAPLRGPEEEEGWLGESAGPSSMAPPGTLAPGAPMSALCGSRGQRCPQGHRGAEHPQPLLGCF